MLKKNKIFTSEQARETKKKKHKNYGIASVFEAIFIAFYLQLSTPNVFLINFEDGKILIFKEEEEEKENLFEKAFCKKLYHFLNFSFPVF